VRQPIALLCAALFAAGAMAQESADPHPPPEPVETLPDERAPPAEVPLLAPSIVEPAADLARPPAVEPPGGTTTAPASAEPAPRPPAHSGYAFTAPRLLTQQLLWGLVHGVRLLANACRGSAAGEGVMTSYADWQDRYQLRISSAARELAMYYYGHPQATLGGLMTALNLRPALDLAPDVLEPACASFAEAVSARRYNLDLYFAMRRDAARMARAVAIRERVRRCQASLDETRRETLAAAFAEWEVTNGALESVVRARIDNLVGSEADAQNWLRDAGAGAAPPGVPCSELALQLNEPTHDLRRAFDDDE
jgi:hypothetical protein